MPFVNPATNYSINQNEDNVLPGKKVGIAGTEFRGRYTRLLLFRTRLFPPE